MILHFPSLSSFWGPSLQNAMIYTLFSKVKHWFSLFHSDPNSTGHPIELQNKTSSCWMESNDTTHSHSEFILGFQVAKSYGYTVFVKVKHWFSLFNSNPNSTGYPIQLQNKTAHVEWSLMMLYFPTLSSFWGPRFQKAIGKVKHCFSLFHSNPNWTHNPTSK